MASQDERRLIPLSASEVAVLYYLATVQDDDDQGDARTLSDLAARWDSGLTSEEGRALLHAYEINEFPISNPLGNRGVERLNTAEAKLRDAFSEEPS
jgi:hypothetical protein